MRIAQTLLRLGPHCARTVSGLCSLAAVAGDRGSASSTAALAFGTIDLERCTVPQ
jgi:hypothetical protein